MKKPDLKFCDIRGDGIIDDSNDNDDPNEEINETDKTVISATNDNETTLETVED